MMHLGLVIGRALLRILSAVRTALLSSRSTIWRALRRIGRSLRRIWRRLRRIRRGLQVFGRIGRSLRRIRRAGITACWTRIRRAGITTSWTSIRRARITASCACVRRRLIGRKRLLLCIRTRVLGRVRRRLRRIRLRSVRSIGLRHAERGWRLTEAYTAGLGIGLSAGGRGGARRSPERRRSLVSLEQRDRRTLGYVEVQTRKVNYSLLHVNYLSNVTRHPQFSSQFYG